MRTWLATLVLFSSFTVSAAPHRSELSELDEAVGIKFPNSLEEGQEPVLVSVQALPSGKPARGFTELLPFALRSPDQQDAGSCLYMSLTGIAEWWLAQRNPGASRDQEGPLDLSERFLMNLAGMEEDENGIPNWKTDSIYLFNKAGGSLRNADYRFTKGWYTKDEQGGLHRSDRVVPSAEYSASYNWIDDREGVAKLPLVRLPGFRRDVLFADPASNQWNTGVMPDDIAERIKAALREKKAPVHVIYNHFGYWHATVILGYDDEQSSQDCRFVRRFIDSMAGQARSLREQAARAAEPKERERLTRRAEKTESAGLGAARSLERVGCRQQGVFYVRDSIYGDPEAPLYDYDPGRQGEEAHYVKKTVLLEYDWVRAMANHVTQITAE